MRLLLSSCLLLVMFTISMKAQTKKIAHKSHSGSNSSFKTVFESGLFDTESSNYGILATETPAFIQPVLDSVIFISKSKAIMVTSHACINIDAKTPVFPNWRPGKDTVTNHPLFSKQHSLDSIKLILKTQYHFKNNMDSVKFIGFDNQKKTSKAGKKKSNESFIPVSGSDNTKPPFNRTLPLMIGVLALCAAFVALFSWKYRQSQ